MESLKGTGVALVTPFRKDLTVDVEALINIVNHVIDGKVDYLVALGTTAENATLTESEKELVLNTILVANRDRLPIVIGIGGNNTAEIVDELQTRDLSPYAAVLSVSPYYNKPTQEGIYQHYRAVAKASKLPVILYNVPGRTSSNILPSTVIRIAKDCNNVIGIKEAAGDIVQAMKLIKDRPKDFLVISGDDMIALPTVLAGGDGVISVIGQGFPALFSEMIMNAMHRKVDVAYKTQYKLVEWIDMIFEQGNPAGIKQLLHELKLCESVLRLPLVPVDKVLAERMREML